MLRSLALTLLLFMLAEPSVTVQVEEHPRPLLLALFDGSESMEMADALTGDSREQLAAVTGKTAEELKGISRLGLVQGALTAGAKESLEQLAEETRIRAYVMDRSDRVREIETSAEGAEGRRGIR